MWIGDGVWAAASPNIALTSSDVSHVGGEVGCKDDNVDDDAIDEDPLSNTFPVLFCSLAWDDTSDGAKEGIDEEGEIMDKEEDDIDEFFLHISM